MRRRGDNARSDDKLGIAPMNLSLGLAIFDRLPRALKREMWESPLNLGLPSLVRPDEVPEVVTNLHAFERVSTVMTWGCNHPQATGPRFKPLGDRRRARR